ncbi:hypothetical protein ACFQ08_36195, partial [Streptosporangium algeriense]
MGGSPLDGISLGVGGPVKAVSFTDEQLKNLGTEFSGRAKDVDGLIHGTGSIGIAPPAFGVLGVGLNSAHDTARDGAVELLKAGKKAIDSWNAALKAASANYKAAEEASTTKEEGGPGLGGPGLGGPGLGGPGLGGGLGDGMKPPGSGTDLPDKDLLNRDLLDKNLPDKDLLDKDLLDRNLPDKDLLDKDQLDRNLPDQDLPGRDLPDSKLPDPNGTNPNLPDPNLPGAKLPDPNGVGDNLNKPGLGLDDPAKTTLSSYDPPGLNNLGDVATTQPRPPGGSTWTGDSLGPDSPGRGGG